MSSQMVSVRAILIALMIIGGAGCGPRSYSPEKENLSVFILSGKTAIPIEAPAATLIEDPKTIKQFIDKSEGVVAFPINMDRLTVVMVTEKDLPGSAHGIYPRFDRGDANRVRINYSYVLPNIPAPQGGMDGTHFFIIAMERTGRDIEIFSDPKAVAAGQIPDRNYLLQPSRKLSPAP